MSNHAQLFRCCPCFSVTKSSLTLCNPMDYSTSGLLVLHHLLEFAQVHVYWISDAIQACYPLLPSSPAFNLSQHQGLFQRVSSSIRWQSIGASASASVLPMTIQHWFPLGLTDLISLQCKGLWRVFSSTTVQKHQFFSTLPSLWSKSVHDYWKNYSFD